jgi:hypothetical protein
MERSLKASRQQKVSPVKASSLKPKTGHTAKSKTTALKTMKKKPAGTKPKPRH